MDSTELLRDAWNRLRATSPHLRIRDAALTLGVSEAALVALSCGRGTTRLRPEWLAILGRVPSLGRVMALTRNEAVVSEVKGTYVAPEFEGHVGSVAGDPIDLRVFLHRWSAGFAVRGEARAEVTRSLQFFDAHGVAVHKVFVEKEGDADAFEAVAREFAADDQSPTQRFAPAATAAPERPDAEVDVPGLLQAWSALTNTHEFFGLLGRFGVTRTQALRLAEGAWTRPLDADFLRPLLEAAAAREVPIMLFVGSEGVIQIRSGAVRNVKVIDDWLNVLDPGFNLHVRTGLVTRAWCVRKPTREGVVTSVELFDAAGRNVMLVFGVREEGVREAGAWRSLVESLVGAS